MKLITSIEKQKKNLYRFNIYLDHQYAFSCNDELIVKLKLKTGNKIDESAITEIIYEDNFKEAFNKGLSYLALRSRSKQEVFTYLVQKGFDEEIVNKAIVRLRDYQFVNDEEYAKTYVKNRCQNQLKGKRLIRQELTKKGIEEKIIEGNLKSYSYEEELGNAIKIGQQFFMNKKSLPLNQIKQKLTNRLMSKGYDWTIITECLGILETDPDLVKALEEQSDFLLEEALKIGKKYFDKLSKKNNDSSFLLKQRVGAYLYQKGYEQEVIRKVLAEL
ncbi:RecX family transcriptional regulator [Alkaliphilus transvaalensis]|uniref:RecX family transcriptional regulator n=1 Tax=Alkaliphilus transvaalensis TaxID=114628 RepID=UPI00047AA882|nr:RecX family transcriptional regulator [Alkaliphilus transvaalensis]